MMEDLIKLVAEKTGVSEEIAAQVIDVVVDVLKDRLPAPFDNQIEGILGGDVDAENLMTSVLGGGSAGGLGGMLGSLFGRGKR